MGATSVTGKGLGSADGKNKGSAHMTLGVNHLIGPRVVAAGIGTLADGACSLDLVPMTGVDADYIVLTNDRTALHASYGTFVAATGTLTLAGTTTDVLTYAIIKVGTAG